MAIYLMCVWELRKSTGYGAVPGLAIVGRLYPLSLKGGGGEWFPETRKSLWVGGPLRRAVARENHSHFQNWR